MLGPSSNDRLLPPRHDPLQVTALTNFLLASPAFYCAGALAGHPARPCSAAWYWRGAMFLLASAALLGGLALAQALACAVALAVFDTFLVVVANYLPVILALLVVNLRGLRQGTGSGSMARGIVLLLLASAVQALGIDALSPIDGDGLCHLISMPAVILLYRGGRRLRTSP